jgi:hypothetical protein
MEEYAEWIACCQDAMWEKEKWKSYRVRYFKLSKVIQLAADQNIQGIVVRILK